MPQFTRKHAEEVICYDSAGGRLIDTGLLVVGASVAGLRRFASESSDSPSSRLRLLAAPTMDTPSEIWVSGVMDADDDGAAFLPAAAPGAAPRMFNARVMLPRAPRTAPRPVPRVAVTLSTIPS